MMNNLRKKSPGMGVQDADNILKVGSSIDMNSLPKRISLAQASMGTKRPPKSGFRNMMGNGGRPLLLNFNKKGK